MQAKRRQMDRHHIFPKGNLFTELLNTQRTPEHPQSRPGRSRSQFTLAIQRAIQIRQKRMTSPPPYI
jgi:hypothetical protein